MAEIGLAQVTKRFEGTLAVDDVTLHVPQGTFATFLGPSGCGKTTTLRMIAGLERPTAGEIRIDAQVVSDAETFVPPEKRQIGMVFQSYAIWPHKTVFDNVAYPLKVRRMPPSLIRERTRTALDRVRLGELAERYPAQLSGGQQQRVALARAIVFEPRLLLLDEPLSNLDAKLREQMRIELRELQQRMRVTTLYVTHDQHEALALSDLVLVMQGGRIVQSGSPRAIYDRPLTRFVADFVGWANFLRGEVAGDCSIRLLGDTLGVAAMPKSLSTGDTVEVSIRPEDVRLLADGAAQGPNVIQGTMRTALFMGSHVLCEIAVGQAVVRAHLEPSIAIAEPGSPVRLSLDPGRILVLRA